MYINANRISVLELEEELSKRHMTIMIAGGKILSIQAEESNVQKA